MGKNLLIISCSARKHKVRGKIKAWDLYDGVIFRVLKKNKVDFKKFEIRIISAKYGLLRPTDKISYYDRRIDKKRALELKKEVTAKLKRVLQKKYKQIYFCAGKDYLLTIDESLSKYTKIKIVKGAIGIKMKKLKRIL